MRTHIACLVTILLSALVLAQDTKAPVPNSNEDVIATMRAIRAAAVSGNAEAWGPLVAPNCSYVEPSGVIASRASHEPKAGDGASTGVKAASELTEIRVHDYGDIAVLTYREDQLVEIGGNATRSATRYTETYRRAGPAWQMIFSAETPIPLPKLIKVDPKTYDDYAGEYQIAPQMVGTVYREGDKLMLVGTGWKKPYELLPVASDTFVVQGMEQNEISFVRDEKGKVTEQSSKYRGQQQGTAKKIK